MNVNDIKFNIIPKMETLLTEYQWKYSREALDDIIDEWYNKKENLLKFFSTCKGWDESELLVKMSVKRDRPLDCETIRNFYLWLTNALRTIPNLTEYQKLTGAAFPNEGALMPEQVAHILRFFAELPTQYITATEAYDINQGLPSVHVHEGQKWSRVMSKLAKALLWDSLEGYNDAFTKFADAINPRTFEENVFLSLNPLDFLSMSFGNSWQSCHTIDKIGVRKYVGQHYRGEFCGGTLSYMLDGCSAVLFTAKEKDGQIDRYNKVARQMYHFGDHLESFIASRLYPQENDELEDPAKPYRELVQQLVATQKNVENKWTFKRGSFGESDGVYTAGVHYEDYYHFRVVRCRLVDKDWEELTIGADPICIECGCRFSDHDTISCCSEAGGYRCYNCAEHIDDGDEIFVDGEAYCNGCAFICDRCGGAYTGDYEWLADIEEQWCPHCAEHHAHRCEDCSEYFAEDDGAYIEHYGYVCDRCYTRGIDRCAYIVCEECGCVYQERDIVRINGTDEWMCTGCAECYAYQCEDCGEWFSSEDEMTHVHGYGNVCSNCYESGVEQKRYCTCKECNSVYINRGTAANKIGRCDDCFEREEDSDEN